MPKKWETLFWFKKLKIKLYVSEPQKEKGKIIRNQLHIAAASKLSIGNTNLTPVYNSLVKLRDISLLTEVYFIQRDESHFFFQEIWISLTIIELHRIKFFSQ